MLAGIRLIPRDEIPPDSQGSSSAEEKDSRRRKRKPSCRRHSSDDDDETKSRSSAKRKKKRKARYSSDDDASSSSSDEERKRKRRSAGKKRSERRREYSSESSSDLVEDGPETKEKGKSGDYLSDDGGEVVARDERESMRKEMGLEWMLESGKKRYSGPAKDESEQQESQVEEGAKINPRELNPYLKDNGSGYPDDHPSHSAANADQLLPSSVVGDGGASWRLKALKRAKEQAVREGRKLDEVVGERWGSLGRLAASTVVHRPAPSHAHLDAIRGRKRGQISNADVTVVSEKRSGEEVGRGSRDYLRNISTRHPEMREPKRDSLRWRKSKDENVSSENTSLIASSISSVNKFSNDGSFMDEITRIQNKHSGASNSCPASVDENDHESKVNDSSELDSVGLQALSANQLAAKVLQLRMKGKHEEADKLSEEMEATIEKKDQRSRKEIDGSTCRYAERKISSERKKKEEDPDLHLARKIIQNKQYNLAGRADDEYDYDDSPRRKGDKRGARMPDEKRNIPKRILTQHERCHFCFENPSRPKHLVVAIANFTYMMLPQSQPVVQGHCCILPMQHEPATRTVDKNVLEEIRNFKKCLIRMFAKQDKDVLFLETVIGLAQQQRHCLLECIPVPSELSTQAPMYFKKAIDEAEGEWGQHEMKKVIQTSGNLRHVIPENFSYFHVEFGLDRGFVHVIDDDSNFKSGFGLNVIRGLLRLPEEDMYRRRRQESLEKQKQAVAAFSQDWEPFDWTKQLD